MMEEQGLADSSHELELAVLFLVSVSAGYLCSGLAMEDKMSFHFLLLFLCLVKSIPSFTRSLCEVLKTIG